MSEIALSGMPESSTVASSNVVAPTSTFVAPRSSLVGGVDVAKVDENLRQITAIESRWNSPELPFEVKFDLATIPGMESGMLAQFLEGIDADLNQPDDEPSPAERIGMNYQAELAARRTPLQEIGLVVSGVANRQGPQRPDPDSVRNWKRRAISMGYLPAQPEDQIDNRWTPDMTRIATQMGYDEVNRRYSGDRIGAVPTDTFVRTIHDWTSPTGLLGAATTLGVFWDFGQVGREFQTWGDKWRDVTRSDNPLDFARNFVDAVTGPVDDLVLPIINVATIVAGFVFTGGAGSAAVIGANAARAGVAGASIARAAAVASGSARFGAIARSAARGASRVMAPQRVEQIMSPGFIGARLTRPALQGTRRQALGNAMNQWRQIPAVARTKQAVGTGMRYGFVAQAQNNADFIGLDYEAASLSDIPQIGSAAERLSDMGFEGIAPESGSFAAQFGGGALVTAGELLFAPLNIFKPGTFLRSGAEAGEEGAALFSRFGSGVLTGRYGLGSAPGRAVVGGAVGTVGGWLAGEDADSMFTGALLGAATAGILPLEPVRRIANRPLGGAVILGGAAGTGVAIWQANERDESVFSPDVMFASVATAAGVAGTSLLLSTSPFAWLPNPGRWVGHAFNGLNRINYAAVAENQQMVATFARAARENVKARVGEGLLPPSALDDFDATMRGTGVFDPGSGLRAVASTLGTDDMEMVNRYMHYVTLSAMSRYVAEVLTQSSDGQSFYNVLNHVRGRITRLDEGLSDELLAQDVANRISSGIVNPQKRRARFEKEYERLVSNPELLRAEVLQRNQDADVFIQELFDLAAQDVREGTDLARRVQRSRMGASMDAFGNPDTGVDETLSDIMTNRSPSSFLEAYLLEDPQRIFSNWNGFVSSSHVVSELAQSRSLDLVPLASWTDIRGNVRQPMRTGSGLTDDEISAVRRGAETGEGLRPETLRRRPAADAVDVDEADDIDDPFGLGGVDEVETPLNPDDISPLDLDNVNESLIDIVMERVWDGTLSVKELDRLVMHAPQDGKIALARTDTLLKNDYSVEADRLDDLVFQSNALDDADVVRALNELEIESGTTLAGMSDDELKQLLRTKVEGLPTAPDFPPSSKLKYQRRVRQKMRQIHRFVHSDNVAGRMAAAAQAGGGYGSVANMRAALKSVIDDELADIDKWSRFKLSTSAPLGKDGKTPLTGLSAVKARAKELRQKQNFVASEVDVETLVRLTEAQQGAGAAQTLRAQIDEVERNGYRLVFGVDFLMPDDIFGRVSDAVSDVTVRHLNSATLGNFFGRRQPATARVNQERMNRVKLAATLDEMGVAPPNGDRWSPNDDLVTNMLIDLERILREEKDELARMVDDRSTRNMFGKLGVSWRSAFAPVIEGDLTRRKELVMDRLLRWGWSQEYADAMFAATRKLRDSEFQDLGLYAFEAKWRERNELVQFLKFLRGDSSGRLLGRESVGLGVGAAIGYEQAEGERGLERLRSAAVGGAIGLGASQAPRFVPDSTFQNAVRWANTRNGYVLFDQYARLRDTLRFGLSPLFDLSRYTEGYVLGQTAAPRTVTEGGAAGRKVVMPLDVSPRGVRRRIRKSENLDVDEAQKVFNQYRSEFRAAAVGDFNPDAPETAMRWMQQIGMAGFNLTDWMAGAYTELRRQGMNAAEAYRAAKEMYTYGVNGRSAAELSVNFVFFPFSFQKKALGSIAKFMQDDLSRSIFITDAFLAYQALNEQYNLDEYWREYIPFMQQLSRLNLFAYGLSAGRLGGINAQLFETIGRGALQVGRDVLGDDPDRGPTSVLADLSRDAQSIAMFTPWVGRINTEEDSLAVQGLIRSLTPVINDTVWMSRNFQELQRTLREGGRPFGQVIDGYQEWNNFRRDVETVLQQGGYTWWHLHRLPALRPLSIEFYRKRAELSEKYPEWQRSRRESIFNAQMLDEERQNHRARFYSGSTDPQDVLYMQFEMEVERVTESLAQQGVDVGGDDGWLDAPIQAVDYLKQVAAEMLEQNPRFRSIWEKFYFREFGPILSEV